MKKTVLLLIITVAITGPAWSATQTVRLSVPGMNCAACPITVKMALSKVAGVEQTQVIYEEREAVVTFDDTKASIGDLIRATANAGYPSAVKPGEIPDE